ncbi:MAG: hypothetical protein SOY80_01475 [Bacilli bacterium]|nr:hypothetical protein [Bacilli bacterium]
MFLITINDIDNFFTSLFDKLRDIFTWQTLVILLAGIIVGFVICSTIYGILMLISLNDHKKSRMDKQLNIDIDNEQIKKEIDEIKEKFVSSTDGLTVKERFEMLGPTLYETINVVASTYYPNSKYPLYELSVSEFILFLRYVSFRVEDIFNKPYLKPFKNMTISQILNFIDLQKKITENKIIHAVANPTTNKIKKFFMAAINYANPVYWFKKLVMGTTINIATKKICLVVIDIVGDETNKTYSKSIFNKENDLYLEEINNELKELEGELGNERQ